MEAVGKLLRVHESLAAWLLPRPTYIHIYTAAAQKQCIRNITQHTYLKLHEEKEFADTIKFVTVAASFVGCYMNNEKNSSRAH